MKQRKGQQSGNETRFAQGEILHILITCSAVAKTVPVECVAVWKEKQWKPRSNKKQTCLPSAEGLATLCVFSEYPFGWMPSILPELCEVVQLMPPGSSSLYFASAYFSDTYSTLAKQPAEKWCDVYSVHVSDDVLQGCKPWSFCNTRA